MKRGKEKDMFHETSEQPSTNLLDTVSDFMVGGGIVTMALFPLAIPIIALLIVALLPLLVVGAGVTFVGAVLAAPVLLIRRLSRNLAARPQRRREAQPVSGHRPMMGAHG